MLFSLQVKMNLHTRLIYCLSILLSFFLNVYEAMYITYLHAVMLSAKLSN